MVQNRALQGLYDRVIEKDLCTACGACASLCPYIRSVKGRTVKLDHCDIEQGRCFEYCPRTEVDLEDIYRKISHREYEDIEMGAFQRVVMCRSTDQTIRAKAQSGGVVSTLMDLALQKKIIDSAILTRRTDNHVPEGQAAHNREQVLACAGSSYVSGPTLESLNREEWNHADRIGFVGIPCQVLALSKMRVSNLQKRTPVDQVALVVGLFCTWAFTYAPFMAFLQQRTGGSPIRKLDITPPPERLLKVTTDSTTLDVPLDEVRPFIRPTCALCLDMTSELSDISVGTAEGFEGWNTVIVRTNTGEELLKLAEAAEAIETRPLPRENMKHLLEASLLKKQRALKNLEERGELETGYLKMSSKLIQRILSETAGTAGG